MFLTVWVVYRITFEQVEKVVEIEFSPTERQEYNKIESKAKATYLAFKQAARTTKDVSRQYLWLTRQLLPMRVACAGGHVPIIDPSLANVPTRPGGGRKAAAPKAENDSDDEDADLLGDDSDTDNDEEIGGQTVAVPREGRNKTVVGMSDFAFKSKLEALLKELRRIRDEEPDSKCMQLDTRWLALGKAYCLELGATSLGTHSKSYLLIAFPCHHCHCLSVCDLLLCPIGKSLVFSQYRTTLQWLQKELPEHGFTFRTLSGNMSMKKRAQALHDFQNDPPTTIFLLSMR